MSDEPAEPAERSGRRVAVIVGAAIGVALPLFVAVITLSGRRWYPVLDLAMTELRVRDVGTRQTPLIGLPGRIGSLPEQGSHPGPLSFWIVAPFYRLFGGSAWAMEAATVIVQTAWMGVALWIGHRRAGLAGMAAVATVLAVLLRGYGLVVLIQPWNPYLPLIAWVVILLALWSVLAGDHLMLIPLVVAASFAAQTHIPYLLMAGGVGLAAAAVVVVRAWRADERRPFVVPLAATGALFAMLWFPPLVDQVRRDPGNIRQLLDHFASPDEHVIGWRMGANVFFRHLDVFDGHLKLLTGTERFVHVSLTPHERIWPGVVMFVVWVAAFVVAVRLRHRPLIALHTTVAVALGLAFVSMARIFGTIWFYLTLWAWGTTTLLLIAVAWTAAAWFTATRSHERPLRAIALPVGAAVAAVVTLTMVVLAPGTDHPEEELGIPVGELLPDTVAALEGGVGAATGPDGRYAVVFQDALSFGSQAFGFVSELEREGLDAGMYSHWRVPVTAQRVIPREQATAEVIYASGGFVERFRADPNVVEVASYDPRTDDERALYRELRDELIAQLEAAGLDDLVPLVDTNLFLLTIDPRLSDDLHVLSVRIGLLGHEAAVFIGPPGAVP